MSVTYGRSSLVALPLIEVIGQWISLISEHLKPLDLFAARAQALTHTMAFQMDTALVAFASIPGPCVVSDSGYMIQPFQTPTGYIDASDYITLWWYLRCVLHHL